MHSHESRIIFINTKINPTSTAQATLYIITIHSKHQHQILSRATYSVALLVLGWDGSSHMHHICIHMHYSYRLKKSTKLIQINTVYTFMQNYIYIILHRKNRSKSTISQTRENHNNSHNNSIV